MHGPDTYNTTDNRVTGAELASWIEAIAVNADRAAFARLFDHFAPRVKAYLLRLSLEEYLAEELMQDTMLTVWTRAALYDRAQSAPSTWIFTIARNKRIDRIRRERRPELDPQDPVWMIDAPAQPDAALVVLQDENRLRLAVAELPPEQKALIEEVYYKDKSHRDIAQESGLPLGTVKSRIRLALARLKRDLG